MQPNNEINYRNYPFTAIVGQEKMKKALILNAINPMIGGVLLRGDKGTGKTTVVRSLIDILPEIEVSDCIFGCSPDSLCDLCKNKPKKNLNLKKKKNEDSRATALGYRGQSCWKYRHRKGIERRSKGVPARNSSGGK